GVNQPGGSSRQTSISSDRPWLVLVEIWYFMASPDAMQNPFPLPKYTTQRRRQAGEFWFFSILPSSYQVRQGTASRYQMPFMAAIIPVGNGLTCDCCAALRGNVADGAG